MQMLQTHINILSTLINLRARLLFAEKFPDTPSAQGTQITVRHLLRSLRSQTNLHKIPAINAAVLSSRQSEIFLLTAPTQPTSSKFTPRTTTRRRKMRKINTKINR